mmetsp:Transcript_48828/g.156160  ORF Transcript_48828/g.156160 Transcript_48828/m.156160 type:complete len:188 (+) Transcript_48828:91-654(+)
MDGCISTIAMTVSVDRGFPDVEPTCRSSARTFWTQATYPMDVCFDVPEGAMGGQQARVSGPHGFLSVPVPDGVRPGDRVTVRLGPNSAYQATVPEHAAEGDTLTLEPPEGETIRFHVPPGVQPGTQFRIEPQVLMVRVPEGAEAGDWVAFAAPGVLEGTASVERVAQVPRGVLAGQYFDVPWDGASS